MSSISLSKPLRITTEPRMVTEAPKEERSRTASVHIQDRSAATDDAFSPSLFWKTISVLALVLCAYNAIGTVLFGTDWLTAYWDALGHWYAWGYCYGLN